MNRNAGNLSKNVLRWRSRGTSESVLASLSPEEIEDPWIAEFAEKVFPRESEDTIFQTLNESCGAALRSLRMPTLRNEEYRFTDLSPLTRAGLYIPKPPSVSDISTTVSNTTLSRDSIRVIVVNGLVQSVEFGAVTLPEGAYIGNASGAPKDVLKFSLGNQSKSRGGPFASLNGSVASDCAVVYVPEECAVAAPVHIINIFSADAIPGKFAFSAPRVLVFLETGASAEVVEEFLSLSDSTNASFSVTEIELDDKASLSHKFVGIENSHSISMKSTLVSQGTESSYSLAEVRLGAELSRHDVGIVQLGERTHTEMKHFLLAGEGQVHDLHTKLTLDYPEGTADQIHKCIAAADTSKGVFDGNVKVNRMAQRTDAGQLSRNLLLAPKATVNVKPNLQIVADDVKCTHGCAVSDLEAEQLFYLQARGIDPSSARKMLVYSFGGEVMQNLQDKNLIDRVQEKATATLDHVFLRQ